MTTPALYLAIIDAAENEATVLCLKHTQSLEFIMQAAGRELGLYELDPADGEVTCQACHLADLVQPRIILPH